ncbi:MAG TPA: DMT family transporter [Thermoanaerobaculia bacterium]|nr:DMT family transporter [Thermoanaerobaculia bacterium]HUM29196.1 DMT family transporter [Thermoanaerobaculia bacterium]HXK67575.1 DMT family transporter [Thermoanaerobaculia bacterium]
MGILLMLLASASFTTMSALVKAAGSSIPPVEMVFLRCVIASPIFYLFIRLRKRNPIIRAKKVLVWRTIFGLSAMAGFFYALTHMPLADTIFIGRSQPLILSLLAPLILGEHAPRSAWIAIGAGLCGVAVIMKPAMAWPIAAWVALGSAACSAMAHLLVRKLNATDTPMVIVFNFTVLSAILTSFVVIPTFVWPTPEQWIYVLGVAVFASFGQLLMTLAYQRDRAPVIASASYSSVILSVVYGYFFWDEIPHPLAWLGGALIVAGGLLLLKARWHASEPPSPAAT